MSPEPLDLRPQLERIKSGSEAHPEADLIRRICSAAEALSPTTRLPTLLSALEAFNAECGPEEEGRQRAAGVIWPVILGQWPHVSDTWDHQPRLLALLLSVKTYRLDWFSPKAQKIFKDWPQEVKIYRGCARGREKGIAWSLDLKVAEGFAAGHGGVPVVDPVILDGMIDKDDILGLIFSRDEAEVLIDTTRFDETPESIAKRKSSHDGDQADAPE